jgi:hypothetical protein
MASTDESGAAVAKIGTMPSGLPASSAMDIEELVKKLNLAEKVRPDWLVSMASWGRRTLV